MKRIALGTLGLTLLSVSAQAKLLPYPEPALKYPQYSDKDEELKNYWSGWKRRFVSNGTVQGNDPSGAKKSISEGQSYGLMLAVWLNDKQAFDQIYQATEQTFWTGTWYRWTPSDNNFAGDADQDICGAMIFASALVDAGYWTNPSGGLPTYKAKAKAILQSLDKNFFDGNGYVYSWPGQNGALNPSYHMPAWHPIFKEFGDSNGVSINWTSRTAAAYKLINAQTGSQYGMARNFSSPSGGASGCGSCSSTPNINDMGFDAIRVPYRMGMAALWYGDKQPEAVTWCQNVWKNGKVDILKPGMYSPIEPPTLWGFGGTDAKYEEFCSRAMWGSAAIAVASKDAKSKAAYDQIGRDFSGKHATAGTGYISGANQDSVGASSPAMNYYSQSLGILGALALYGRAWNVWDDLKHKWVVPDTGAQIVTALKANPNPVEKVPTGSAATTANLTVVTAKLSKAVPVYVRFTGVTSKAYFVSPEVTTDSVTVQWTTNKKSASSPAAFAEEAVEIRLMFPGVDTATNAKARSTITVKTSGLLPGVHAVRGEGTARWVEQGIHLDDAAWMAGQSADAKILDLAGRTIKSESVLLVAQGEGVRVPTTLTASRGLHILELSNGAQARRYVLSPNP